MGRVAAALAMLIGLLVMIGWRFQIRWLTHFDLGPMPAKMLSAVNGLLLGAAVLSLDPALPSWCRRMAIGTAALTAVLAGFALLSSAAELDFPVERALADWLLGNGAANETLRIAPAAAASFLSLSLGVLVMQLAARPRLVTAWLILLPGLIALLAVLGHCYGVKSLYQWHGYSPMAFPTALTLICLTIALACARPLAPPASLFTSATTGGFLARRLIPVAILAPPVIIGLLLWGGHLGLYGVHLGLALASMLTILVFSGLIHLVAQRVDDSERERQRVERALQSSETRLELVTRTARDALWDLNLVTGQLWWSEGIERVFGHDVMAIPNTLNWWAEQVHPADRARVEHSLDTAQRGAVDSWEQEYRFRRADGSYAHVSDRGAVTRDRRGRAIRMIGSITDITGRKKAEQALSEAKAEIEHYARNLEETVRDRTAALTETVHELERFSYTLSHDLRAPLRAMRSFSQLLVSKYRSALNSQGVMYLDRIAAAAERLDQLITDVLTYSRLVGEPLELEPVDLDALVGQLLAENPRLQPPAVDIRFCTPLLPVRANVAYLTQAVSNLLYNAVKFVPAGRTPVVLIWTEAAGNRVRLLVQDNGIGISPEDQPRIFGMFERLHAHYEGTGIGLAIVRKAMERMRGQVGVRSESGQGATFWLELEERGPS
jgi:PAS domain S-box-containing protein